MHMAFCREHLPAQSSYYMHMEFCRDQLPGQSSCYMYRAFVAVRKTFGDTRQGAPATYENISPRNTASVNSITWKKKTSVVARTLADMQQACNAKDT
jgi:hypothetical protein